MFIYVLLLVNNKYYVGKTKNPEFRISSHFRSDGSEWTKKYKPKKLLKMYKNCDSYDEDKITLKYMSKYGIENVRGGSFCKLYLNRENKNTIEQMLKGTNDQCFKCGEKVILQMIVIIIPIRMMKKILIILKKKYYKNVKNIITY